MTYTLIFLAGVVLGMLAILLAPKRERVERLSAVLRGTQEPPRN